MDQEEKRRRQRRLAMPRNDDDRLFNSDLLSILTRIGGMENSFLARQIGIRNLRKVFEIGSPKSREFFRADVRPRLDKEFEGGNKFKEADDECDLIKFGNCVIEFRKRTDTNEEAYKLAADHVKLKSDSKRSFERTYARFKKLCRKLGRVPHVMEDLGVPPQFTLADLDLDRATHRKSSLSQT